MSYADTALSLKLQFPRDYIALSRGFTSSHKGIDMCWNSAYGGQNAPVFAPADGEVVTTMDGMGNTYKTGVSNWGNYVKIKHANGVYTLCAHLQKGSLTVKAGQKVTRGQQIANMNNSGYSNGSHVHFEVYVGGSGTAYRVDPLKYVYAYPGQTVNERGFDILRYNPTLVVGNPVPRDTSTDQIAITATNLYARSDHSTSSIKLGFCKPGYYNVRESFVESAKRTWYYVGDFWCASDGAKYLKKEARYNVSLTDISAADLKSIDAVAKQLGVDYTVEEI